jgi:hypothetical protein
MPEGAAVAERRLALDSSTMHLSSRGCLDWLRRPRRTSGEELTVDDVWAVAVGGAGATLAGSARERMRAAREIVSRAAHGEREHTYGINTGFGKFVSQTIPSEQTSELQLRLLRSHACGVGEPYPAEVGAPRCSARTSPRATRGRASRSSSCWSNA